jgi:asparagine synthase (glutamine-hydrolysing)
VLELEAGSYLEIDCISLSVTKAKWWDINTFYRQKNDDNFSEGLEKTDSFLNAAVKRRLESSDLEVGCFLSGGIDSGLITAIASQANRSLKTFTVSFDGEYNEAPLAKLVADKYQTQHTEIPISFSHLKNDLEGILCNYGEPFFDSSAIPSYYVSKEAKKYVTVILNGDGADELFGGYRRYVPFAQYDFFRASKWVKSIAGCVLRILPFPNRKKSMYNYLYRLASFASKDNINIYLSAGVDIMEGFETNLQQEESLYLQEIRNDFYQTANNPVSGLKKIMNLDFNINLFGDLLVKMDIATMANSLEGRSPFLSKELLEYIPGINDEFKINGKITKKLLRELAKRYLPESSIMQPKRGFEVPLINWVEQDLNEMILDYVCSNTSLSKHFFKTDYFINTLINKSKKVSPEKRAKILWTLFCMEVWYKKVYLGQ